VTKDPPPLHVLIVDDDAGGRAVEQSLRWSGVEAVFARVETEQALRDALPDGRFDVVLADHVHPGFGALHVLEILEEVDPDLPLIVVSEAIDPETLVALMRAGARDFVSRRQLERLPTLVDRERRAAAERRARRADERRRQEDDERRRALIEEIPALTYIAWADELGATAYLSPQIRAMTGFTTAEWLADNESWARQIHPEDRLRVLREFRASCAGGEPFSSEYRIVTKDGLVRWWHDQGRVLMGPDDRARFVRGFVLDVTDRKQAEETIRRLSTHDILTGLPNRALLHERLADEVARGRTEDRPVGLLILSLDRFREINNTLGQQNGDLIIQQVARRLGDVLGQDERVARLRGDEFGILLPGADVRLAQQVATKVLAALERPFVVMRLPIEVSGSVGISVFPGHGDDAETLLRRADLAVLAAKREPGSFVVYTPECDPYDPQRLNLLGELRRALEGDELLLHYQPKVDIKARALVGAEALLRWRHPRHGMVPPDEFIPLAEKSGLIKPLARWVLKEAVRQCRRWAHGGRALPVAVNLSARNLQDPSLVSQISELLAAEGVAAGQLRVELTESAVMSDPGRAVLSLRQLRLAGIEMALDDFGTGYSSLAYLQTLPVSELKIDKTFIIGMAGNGTGKATIVRSTSDLGHNLGLTVVAEGVEDEPTLELLGSYGCDAAQGYHIARPMKAVDFDQWLAASPWAAPRASG
jgi:diguanylate cyclase (GGDEF)-like protein/PAS domain S-box-containing protein